MRARHGLGGVHQVIMLAIAAGAQHTSSHLFWNIKIVGVGNKKQALFIHCSIRKTVPNDL